MQYRPMGRSSTDDTLLSFNFSSSFHSDIAANWSIIFLLISLFSSDQWVDRQLTIPCFLSIFLLHFILT
ncbi:hypothetical protein Y032_0013g2038 [Ancylostoma ceylanicum]|uniref:Uncharacterized protein n=1 Tax=Ancylostoma ceylanicum TaxID=53326 RepID=A0A016VAI4_9BILA|nr:hypothetical protein Y032_0013g2038 [Ancylostoma ceylanicum]